MQDRRSALITGSTSGIGLGIARVLAGQGYDVMLNGFGEADEIEDLKTQLATSGHRVEYHGADLTDPAATAEMVEATVGTFGRLDVLVNNAGIQHVSPIESFPDDAWHRIIAVNLSAAFFATRSALPHMREAGWGRIVNTASVHGLVASVNKSAYIAAKHGLVGLTKEVALETAGSGITCNAICPGFVRTELLERQIEAHADERDISIELAARELLADKQPSGTFASVDQIGQMVVFLCSTAADQITGAALPVDGGWTAR